MWTNVSYFRPAGQLQKAELESDRFFDAENESDRRISLARQMDLKGKD